MMTVMDGSATVPTDEAGPHGACESLSSMAIRQYCAESVKTACRGECLK